MDNGRLQSRYGCNAAAWRQRRLLDRQRLDWSQSRAGRKTLVPLDGGKPAVAAQGYPLPQPGVRGARLRIGVRYRDLQLLSWLGSDAVPWRTGQPDEAPSHAQRRRIAAGWLSSLSPLSRCRYARS